ncbi:hypothetical protein V6N12_045487 [Hibiscus sabdariffa]|uniref:Uncharacterized protein n=1 Tax=Hibiscus sabdariffa TaxID=183260 RepID=A0ABR2G2X7_9ROSI
MCSKNYFLVPSHHRVQEGLMVGYGQERQGLSTVTDHTTEITSELDLGQFYRLVRGMREMEVRKLANESRPIEFSARKRGLLMSGRNQAVIKRKQSGKVGEKHVSQKAAPPHARLVGDVPSSPKKMEAEPNSIFKEGLSMVEREALAVWEVSRTLEVSFNDGKSRWKFVQDLDLMDLFLLEGANTWSNNHENPTFVRIDRFLISGHFSIAFPNVLQKMLSKSLSDYNAIILFEEAKNWGTNLLRCSTTALKGRDLMTRLSTQ